MTKARITFQAQLPAVTGHLPVGVMDPIARSRVLDDIWQERRRIAWHETIETLNPGEKSHPTQHTASLSLCHLAAADSHDGHTARLSIDLEPGKEEIPIEKAKRLLDLPIVTSPRNRRSASDQSFGRASFHKIKGASVIGPMSQQWPIGRNVTAYSQYLGSYGQGGVGLSGWQLNGGSWMVLPISDSQSWITLTKETTRFNDDPIRLDIEIDQRIVGVHPNGKPAFWPWEHRYCGHDPIMELPDFGELRPRVARFAATESGFLLEAGDGGQIWRFEIGDHLPRPGWGGTGQPRDLYEGENMAGAFLLAHDAYLHV